MTTSFKSRASGKSADRRWGMGWIFPRGFARLRWQLFVRRVEQAQTQFAHKQLRRMRVAAPTPFDAAEYLNTRAARAEYLRAAAETKDQAFIADAHEVVARACRGGT